MDAEVRKLRAKLAEARRTIRDLKSELRAEERDDEAIESRVAELQGLLADALADDDDEATPVPGHGPSDGHDDWPVNSDDVWPVNYYDPADPTHPVYPRDGAQVLHTLESWGIPLEPDADPNHRTIAMYVVGPDDVARPVIMWSASWDALTAEQVSNVSSIHSLGRYSGATYSRNATGTNPDVDEVADAGIESYDQFD